MIGNRFEGLRDDQWQVLEEFLPKEPEKRGRGKPHTPWRKVCSSLLWILINGAKWCDLPKGEQWASRSATHRWLGVWQTNGTLEKMLVAIREQAELQGLLNFERLAADGFFSAGKGGGQLVDHGYKGKGVTTHLLTDGNGNPINFEVTSAKEDEKQQVDKLLGGVEKFTNRRYTESGLISIFEADKGYDADWLRDTLLRRKIYPFIPYRMIGAAKKTEKVVCKLAKLRWKVERAISWLQRKFRRLAVRWERRLCYWKGLLNLSLIFFWIGKLKKLPG